VLPKFWSSHADSKAHPFEREHFPAGLKSSSALLKQGAPTQRMFKNQPFRTLILKG
jgi:hypothetical protein